MITNFHIFELISTPPEVGDYVIVQINAAGGSKFDQLNNFIINHVGTINLISSRQPTDSFRGANFRVCYDVATVDMATSRGLGHWFDISDPDSGYYLIRWVSSSEMIYRTKDRNSIEAFIKGRTFDL